MSDLEKTQPTEGSEVPFWFLDTTAGLQNSELLQTYHGRDGRPLQPQSPRQPPQEFCWEARYVVIGQIGQGAQGVVYLGRRDGADGFHTKVAMKVYIRHEQWSHEEYVTEMGRVATQAQRISQIQHDNLMMVQNFVAQDETRIMVMEWIDGMDLQQLLDLNQWESLRQRISPQEWEHLNDVVATKGEHHCRLKPGIAVDILRGALAGVAALHNDEIMHCDLKPANIMIKRSGTKKVVDVDSSCLLSDAVQQVRGTPYYMAPERFRRGPLFLNADVASLGYILIEMLTGRRIFKHCRSRSELLKAKLELPGQLPGLLPPEVTRNALLTGLIERMIAVEPAHRFADADAADVEKAGAANFHRHLVMTDLATDYRRELAWWMELIAY